MPFASLPPQPVIEIKVELLLAGSVRAFSPAHPLSTAEKVAFVMGKNDRGLGVQYGLYPASGDKPSFVSGAEANRLAQSLFGTPLLGLVNRARVAGRNDQSMVDPYHARITATYLGKYGMSVQFTIHHRTGPAWNMGRDETVGQGEALLRANADGGWRVTAYEARLKHK